MIHVPCSLNMSSMAEGRGNASDLFSPNELSTAATCSPSPSLEGFSLLADRGRVKEGEIPRESV